MSKGIILLLIYVGWRIFKFYQKTMQENATDSRKKAPQANQEKKGKSAFDELLEEIERSKNKSKTSDTYTQTSYSDDSEPISSEKEDWEFGKDELKTARDAHERHKTPFVRSGMVASESEANHLADEFDIKKAIVYSEILNAPYIDKPY